VSDLPGLELLVLYGSRAREDALDEHSDWDFAYLATEPFDELELRARLSSALHTDAVDVTDLARSGGLLRYQVARDGVAVFERSPGAFERFAYPAVLFWLDARHVLEAAHEAILESLG
jgi:predicted nucleotidyltransferase